MKKTLLILCCMLFLSTHLFSQTLVSGGIYSNTTWTLANSPYLVTGSIVVFPGVTLNIQPGVEVRVKEIAGFNKIYIEARGTINMVGTMAAKITFRADTAINQFGQWGGFRIKESLGGSMTYDYINISNAISLFVADQSNNSTKTINHSEFKYNGICFDGDIGSMKTFNLNNCKFYGNQVGVYGYGNFIIKNCTFDNNDNGVYCAPTSFSMNNCKFNNNQYGLFLQYPGAITIKKSTFNNNIYGAIMPGGTADSCKFINNQNALELGAATIKNSIVDSNLNSISVNNNSIVTNCRITNNKNGIIINPLQANQTPPSIIFNKICYNDTFNIKNKSISNLFIPSNCFCETDSTIIESKIYDGYDDITSGLISYSIFDSACLLVLKTVNKLGTASGVQSNQLSTFSIYPNPTSEFINIDNVGNSTSIEFFSITGASQFKMDLINGNNKIDLTMLPKGIYYAKINNKDTSNQLLKIVKM